MIAVRIPLSDDKHQMVRENSKKRTGQRRRNSNPVATLPHAAVVLYATIYCGMYIPLCDHNGLTQQIWRGWSLFQIRSTNPCKSSSI